MKTTIYSILTICLIGIVAQCSSVAIAATLPGSQTNHALGSSASQSSTPSWAGDANLAVDGTFNGDFYYITPNTPTYAVTHTIEGTDPWWQTQLPSNKGIDRIELFNRLDESLAIAGRLQDITISIYDVNDTGLTTPLATSPALNPANVNGSPSVLAWDVAAQTGGSVTGGIVRVSMNTEGNAEVLSLAEVAILKYDGIEVSPNVAAGKPSFQTSTDFNGPASFANDGNTDGNWRKSSVSHTDVSDGVKEYWEVDLGVMHDLDAVTVWSRLDNGYYQSGPTHDFQVEVFDDTHSSVYLSENLNPSDVLKAPLSITENLLGLGVQGRYVRISSTIPTNISTSTYGYLTLAEVQVFGTVTVPEPSSIVLLTLGAIGLLLSGIRKRKLS